MRPIGETPVIVPDREVDEERNPASRDLHVSDALFATGRPAKTTAGFVTADLNGIHSTHEEGAQPACIGGLKPSASCGRSPPWLWYAQ